MRLRVVLRDGQRRAAGPATAGQAALSGVACLAWTLALELLITVAGEKIGIRAFPLNAMYLTAWPVHRWKPGR